jgi:hypothetical protein
MGQSNDTAPFLRFFTAANSAPKGASNRLPESDMNQQEPGSMLGIIILVLVLAAGASGVILYGPTKTINAARDLMQPHKSPPKDSSTDNNPDIEVKPARSIVRKHRATKIVSTIMDSAQPALPIASPAPPLPRFQAGKVQVGMFRRELLELWGAPNMKATSRVDGHLVENYSYASALRPAQTVVLRDGLIISTGDN